jgi:hypothetical protein
MALSLRKSGEKPTEPAPRQSPQARREELQAERRAVVAEIVRLESEGIRATSRPIGPSIRARAVALVAGEDDPPTEVAAAGEGTKLSQLFERSTVIEAALQILALQIAQEDGARCRALMEAEKPQWIAACRKRVLLAKSLQAANAEHENFRRRYGELGGSLPTSAFRLLGWGLAGDEVDRACQEMLRLGMVTKKEIP